MDFILGIDEKDLSFWQMALRAIVIYISAILMVRIGDKRFLGKTTAFDFLLGVIIGSVLSRAVNGGAPLIPSITAAAVLVLVHFLFASIAFKSRFFGKMIKGKSRVLIEDGKINWDNMKTSHITKHDLQSEVRQSGFIKLEDVEYACLERNGQISIILKNSEE